MKSTRRHELQRNVLDLELSKVLDFFRRRGAQIAWGALVAALIAFIAVYAHGRRRQKHDRLQAQYDRLMVDPDIPRRERLEGFEALAGQDDDGFLAAMASMAAGDECAGQLLLDGPKLSRAQQKLLAEQATRHYRRVIEDFPDRKVILARAHLGLGKLAEGRRDFQAARAEYEVVLRMDALSGQPVMELVEESLRNLRIFTEPVRMATTAPAQPAPSTAPAGAEESVGPKKS